MPRIAFVLALSFLMSACVADSHPHQTPVDPTDYKGVPTDDRPPVMIIAPAKPGAPQ